MFKLTRIALVLFAAIAVVAPSAQAQTTGTLIGRIADEQGAAVSAATVRATQIDTGFSRAVESDGSGVYRLAALPVGTYIVAIARDGLSPFTREPVVMNVGTTVTLDVVLKVEQVREQVTVSADAPGVSTRSSSVGEVVDLNRIQSLPLNGRQFANLAAIVPGVGLAFHSDVSKSTQYAPQISGGNGRNVNYQVDGGDNNDDTVGGLLQLFPLEAIQEFNLVTQRFDAEYGRSNGGILNVITKSGTNTLRGSWFSLLRNDALNAQTHTEAVSKVGKQEYARYQYGGSLGGPVVRDRLHYFAAWERTQQDTKQVVNTRGIFPSEDGIFPIGVRENLFTAKATAVVNPAHYLSVRYGRDTGAQPSGAGPLAAPSSWSTSDSTFDSLNGNHNWIVGGAALNEFVFQFSRFANVVPVRASGPAIMAPSRVTGGGTLAPQETRQTKWQLRDDFSWTRDGIGLAHEFKAGVNWIHEPSLFTSTLQGASGIYTLLSDDINGPVQSVFQTGGNTSGKVPLDLYGVYLQDAWRVTNRLTVNAGVRWDYVSGMPLDQSNSYNFQVLQTAGQSGRFAGTILDDFGKPTRGDYNNIQPRLGAAYDVRGDGRDIIRGGWGIYTDLGYTASNALLSSYDAGGGGGIIFSVFNPAGIRKADGTFFKASDPLSAIADQNAVDLSLPRTTGEVVSPRLEQPFSYQTNLGWEHQLGAFTSLSADYVRVDGRDLNMRLRVNTLVNGQRYLSGIPIVPNNASFRVAVSDGRSRYDGLILAIRRRMHARLDLSASYTLAKATSTVGTASDEVAQNLVQDITDPLAPVQDGPSMRTDARHRVTISAIAEAPWGIRIAPIFSFYSALPMQTSEGIDLNKDGNNNDKTALAYRYTGLNAQGIATFEEDGSCRTVNCSRRAPFSQLNLRVSKSFGLPGSARIEAIVEVFNLFNALNPFIPVSMARTNNGKPLASFMQPIAYAGDVGQAEQRVGQVGFRVTF